MSDETTTDTPEQAEIPRPDDTEADSYEAIQVEVDTHFGGSWEQFLKAVSNAKEVLHFVLVNRCETNPTKFEAWAEEIKLPVGWVQRFYMTLTPDGALKPDEPAPGA